ncbi:hypothetical protein T484DRAFT_1616713, partial [Baffinella frigidus]
NLKPSTLSPQPSTPNPQSSTLNPQPSTRNPQPETLNPKPQTRYGNVDANETMKSIFINVTKQGRYFIALQSRELRYGVRAVGVRV